MTFVEKHRFEGGRTEREILKIAWEGEIFGAGQFESMAERYTERAPELTACATTEWLNAHLCEDFGHAAGVHVCIEQAERLGNEGETLAGLSRSFHAAARMTIVETLPADPLYERLSSCARTSELAQLGKDLLEHEDAPRTWMRSELDRESNGVKGVFAYLDRQGISREDAVMPRKRREERAGDRQRLVLATFASESNADRAAKAMKNWEMATEYMKVDAIGVLVKNEDGNVKQAGKKGTGIGVVLGLIAAIPTGGPSLPGGAIGGAVGGGIIGDSSTKA